MQITTVFVIACILGTVSLGTARISRPKKFYSQRNGQRSNNVRDRVENVENRRTSGMHDWSYATITGPDKWVVEYPQCGGSSQSPVNIVERKTARDNLMPIKFSLYGKPLSNFQVQNNGHTVVFSIPNGEDPSIGGGSFPVAYNFSQFHFHWGKHDALGSEHTINGKSYPMEIHLVHENEEEMAAGRTGIAVLSAFFEITKDDNPHLDVIVKTLRQVRKADQAMPMNASIRLFPLIPKQSKHFFRYVGSLTTPPCTEGVLWTIFKETLPISRKQLQAFRDLHEFPEMKHHKLYDNFRPTQKLNGRKIMESKPSYYR